MEDKKGLSSPKSKVESGVKDLEIMHAFRTNCLNMCTTVQCVVDIYSNYKCTITSELLIDCVPATFQSPAMINNMIPGKGLLSPISNTIYPFIDCN